jgi:hypothetical protein
LKKQPKPRKWRTWGQRRRGDGATPAILTILALAGGLVIVATTVMHEARLAPVRRGEWVALPWNDAWPALPVDRGDPPLRPDIARAVYAFAGRRPGVLTYIPCFCGCATEGHHSVHACYVRRRSAEGVVLEWNDHGLSCPLSTDITGDVMLWLEQGKSLSTIRAAIQREYRSRGPSTPTPPPAHEHQR